MKQITFEIDGALVGKGRPRFTRSGHAYTPTQTALYERKVRKAYQAAGGIMFDDLVHVEFEAVYGIQKSATKSQKAARLNGEEIAVKKPDIDNIEKILYDSLTGLAWHDDTQVVSVRAIKGRYEDKPRLICRIREITPEQVTEMHGYLFGDNDD